jgi:nitrite reductase/ring-hydroxylating ferredoxin subunit
MRDDDRGVDRNRRRLLTLLALCPLAPACEFADVIGTPSGQRVGTFSLSDPGFEALADVGGMACIRVDLIDILLIRASDTEVLAFERFCPHEGRDMGPCDGNPKPLAIDLEAGLMRCQHHFSTFALDGTYVRGQASRDLLVFDVEFDADAGRGAVILPGGSTTGPPAEVAKRLDASSRNDQNPMPPTCGGDA